MSINDITQEILELEIPAIGWDRQESINKFIESLKIAERIKGFYVGSIWAPVGEFRSRHARVAVAYIQTNYSLVIVEVHPESIFASTIDLRDIYRFCIRKELDEKEGETYYIYFEMGSKIVDLSFKNIPDERLGFFSGLGNLINAQKAWGLYYKCKYCSAEIKISE